VKGFLGFVLFLAVSGISCSEKEDLSESTKGSDSGRVVEVLEMPEGYDKNQDMHEAARSLGVGIEDLIKLGRNFTLDGGSHTWVYRFDEEGRLTDTLLFRRTDDGQNPAHPNPRPIVEGEKIITKVFRETVANRLIRRVELNADEIAHELDKIEQYLIGYLGEEKFRFYYEGGEIDEPDDHLVPEQEGDGSDPDPFAPNPPVTKEEWRETISFLNHMEAQSIAWLIRSYREEAKEAEERKGKRD
jgi:hypothetical protein